MLLYRSLLAAAIAPLLSAGIASAALNEQSANGITYISGGIGQDESKALLAAAPRYSLALTFTASSGAYLSDVRVTVKKASGQSLFSATSDGPMLLLKLPPGKYRLNATFAGKTVTQDISLAKGAHKRLTLRWPVPVNVVPPSTAADKAPPPEPPAAPDLPPSPPPPPPGGTQ
ncbi:MAG: carboxypeptidase regulatory-like domain-containing protein [Zoogloea sp.]|nr:carboxypeptidase regulatory-like domain-containing protein [Zoogloea sp.]